MWREQEAWVMNGWAPLSCACLRWLTWLLGARGMLVISNPYSEPMVYSRSVQRSAVCQEPEVTCVTRNWSHRRWRSDCGRHQVYPPQTPIIESPACDRLPTPTIGSGNLNAQQEDRWEPCAWWGGQGLPWVKYINYLEILRAWLRLHCNQF